MLRLKGIKEVFNDYIEPSLMLTTTMCDFKCENEGLCPIGSCQNSQLTKEPDLKVSCDTIIKMFNENIFVKAIIFSGMEPFMQFDEIFEFIYEFRKTNSETIVIYTGYYPNEIAEEINSLKQYINIIIKFGRFIANSESIYDEVLGIKLASNNQFAKRIEDL